MSCIMGGAVYCKNKLSWDCHTWETSLSRLTTGLIRSRTEWQRIFQLRVYGHIFKVGGHGARVPAQNTKMFKKQGQGLPMRGEGGGHRAQAVCPSPLWRLVPPFNSPPPIQIWSPPPPFHIKLSQSPRPLLLFKSFFKICWQILQSWSWTSTSTGVTIAKLSPALACNGWPFVGFFKKWRFVKFRRSSLPPH